MFNENTMECTCDKCSYSWRSRAGNLAGTPKKCCKCGSVNWNTGTRSFSYILARAYGREPENNLRTFGILEELTNPRTESDDFFHISPKDDEFFKKIKTPGGSAILLIGDFEIGLDKVLVIKDLKLIYVHEAFINSYSSLMLVYQKPKKKT